MSCSSTIKCPLCLGPLKDPYLLPCGHNLCKACIDRAVDFQKAVDVVKGVQAKKPKTDEDKEGKRETDRIFVCPSCGKKCNAEKCVPNEEMRHIVALETEMSKKRVSSGKVHVSAEDGSKSDVCGFCGKPATIYCCFCGGLCKEHSDFLHVTGPMKTHELSERPRSVLEAAFNVTGTASKMKEKDSYETMPLCSDHNQPLVLFCKDCKVPVCSSCSAFGSHKGHNCVGFNEVADEQRALLKKMVAEVEEKRKECEATLASYERMAKISDSERFSVSVDVSRQFKALKRLIEEKEKEAQETVKRSYAEFQSSLDARIKATHVLQAEAERLLALSKEKLSSASDEKGSSGRFDMSLYSVSQTMGKVHDAIVFLSAMRPPEKDGICRVIYSRTPEEILKNYFSVSCPLLFGGSDVVPIDFEKLKDVTAVPAFPANHDSVHDGGAILDPQRRLVVAYCGSYNSGRTLLVTHLPDVGFEGATTETRERVVPFGVHGQYPIFDGKKYVYFFQSEDGSNDRCARMDLDDFTFHEFTRHRDRFMEYTSGCVVGNRVFIMDSDRHLTYLDTDTDTWTDTELRLDGRCRLLSNPMDDKHIYAVSTNDRIFTIDLTSFTSSTLCDIPGSYSLDANNEALLVCTSPENFAIFTYFRDKIHVYNSDSKSWTRLERLRYSRGGGGHMVCDTKSSFVYFHSSGSSNWDAFPLI